jgi:hypothetical protein
VTPFITTTLQLMKSTVLAERETGAFTQYSDYVHHYYSTADEIYCASNNRNWILQLRQWLFSSLQLYSWWNLLCKEKEKLVPSANTVTTFTITTLQLMKSTVLAERETGAFSQHSDYFHHHYSTANGIYCASRKRNWSLHPTQLLLSSLQVYSWWNLLIYCASRMRDWSLQPI